MWTSLFEAIGEGFRFLSSLVRRAPRQTGPIESDVADQQRSETAAGAAANHASHIAGRPTK